MLIAADQVRCETRQLDLTMLRSLLTLTEMVSVKLWVKSLILIATARVGREQLEGEQKNDVVAG